MTIRRRLRRNTHKKHPDVLSKACGNAIAFCNTALVQQQLDLGIDGGMEGYAHVTRGARRFTHLTLLSIAALVDSEEDQVLMLPLVLARTGNIEQVDSRGRTLLHFVSLRRVARYLLEEGVPVEDGMREPLISALGQPPGTASFHGSVPIAFVDHKGNEPPILACVRAGTAQLSPMPGSGSIDHLHWSDVMPKDEYETLIHAAASQEQRARQSRRLEARAVELGEEDRFAEAGRLVLDNATIVCAHHRPALRIDITFKAALRRAIEQGRPSHVRRLVDLGADLDTPWYANNEFSDHVSALGLAVLTACETEGDDDSEPPDCGVLASLAHMAKQSSLAGVHAGDGLTSMHLAYHPEVARWLLEHGAPYDVKDAKGRLPADVLPLHAARLIEAHHLSGGLPEAPTDVCRRRRL